MSSSEIPTYFAGNGTVNPLLSKVGIYTPFYIAIAISCVILGLILILNVVCCCSRYSDYWLDRHTGNRWIVSIWSSTPHKQPALDYTELESSYAQAPKTQVQYVHSFPEEYQEGHKRESEIASSFSQQPLTSSQEFLELHKRESDI